MKKAILGFLIGSLYMSYAFAEDIGRKVDVASGEILVKLALPSTQYKNSSFDFPPDNSDETFLIYPILGATEGFVAHFAVNPWTGDVWDMDECKRLTNAALLKLQTKIKERFQGKELKEYDRLHKLKPYRMYNLEACP